MMSAKAALKAGVGLLTVGIPESLHTSFVANCPEAMWVPLPETPNGSLALEGLGKIRQFFNKVSALAVGPGLGSEPETHSLIRETLNLWKGNAVIDADALRSDIIEKVSRPERLILTPHSGEFKRISITESVSEYSSRTGSIVIYKEPHTQIVSSKKTVFAFSGSSLLARGGSGDLLTGIINGDLQTSDTSRVKHLLRLRLQLRDDELVGAVEAVTNLNPQWLQGKRVYPLAYYGLSHLTRLKRVSIIGSQRSLLSPKDLSGWEVVKDYDFKNHGPIAVEDGVLTLGKGSPASGVRIKGEFPKMNYEVEFEARRVDGSDFFCGLTFPIQESHCTLIIGGWGGGVVGLSNIDTMAAVENETTRYLEVEDNRWYKVALTVSEQQIQVWIDNLEYANVKTKEHKFDIWWEQEPARPFGLVSWNTGAEFRNIQIKPVAPELLTR